MSNLTSTPSLSVNHEFARAQYRPDLLTLARQSRGMTQKDLAVRTGLSQPTISRLEEQASPSDDQLDRLSKALGYPIPFFYQTDPIYGFGVGELFHRRRKTIPATTLQAVHAEMNIRTMVIRRLVKAVDIPPVDLPIVDQDSLPTSAQDAARALRARWRVPSGPVRSVSDLLERSGILVIPGNFDTHQVDAIGLWPLQLPPVIFVNTAVTQDRLRLTLMHEVGHFVLHAGWGLDLGPEIEDEANLFSAEFLMPANEIAPHLRNLSLAKLAQLKRHWRVSMAALLVRAKETNAITLRQYQSLWTEMGKLGYRKREPPEFEVTGETPGASFHEIVRIHTELLKYPGDELARMTNLTTEEFEEKYLGVMQGPRLVPPVVPAKPIVQLHNRRG